MLNKYVIIRTINAGVHAGYLKKNNKDSVILTESRRIWSWSGAASLSQLAIYGPGKPKECKFAVKLPEI